MRISDDKVVQLIEDPDHPFLVVKSDSSGEEIQFRKEDIPRLRAGGQLTPTLTITDAELPYLQKAIQYFEPYLSATP